MNLVIKQVQKLSILLLLWVSLPTFLLLTNPETLPLPLLILPFVLLFVALYKTAQAVLSMLFKGLSRRRVRLMSGIIALLPTLLLILASIQQLTIRDIAIVVGLIILLTFYMRRIDFLNI